MNRKTGLRGEEQARAYLKSKGYVIQEINYRVRAGEIDIIAIKGQTVAFVEVKARRSRIFGGAVSALPQKRIERLRNASSAYLSLHEELSSHQIALKLIAIQGCEVAEIDLD